MSRFFNQNWSHPLPKPPNTGPGTSRIQYLASVERIDITSGRPPSVDRPEGSKAVFLTFDGLRNAKVRDKDTRIRIALQGPQAVRLWRLLGERLRVRNWPLCHR